MERFKLDLHIHKISKIHEVKDMKRRHQTAIVGRIKDSESLDAISHYNLKSLDLYCCNSIKLSSLINFLNNLPSLRIFNAYDTITDDLQGTGLKKKVKNNLIELLCDVKMIHIFDCCTVEKLELYCNTFDDNSKTKAIEFLMQQKNLEDFCLYEKYVPQFFIQPDIFGFKFALKNFDYRNGFEPFPHYESFIKFLNQHKKTLTCLKVWVSTEPQFGIEFIHKFALQNIVNLKHLKIGYFESEFYGYIGDKITYNELSEATNITRNLESLEVRARSTDMNENRRFYDMFPNLKCLELDGTFSDDIGLLRCISERCVNVEKLILVILKFESQIPGPIYFPKLKELSLNGHISDENLSAIINRHSRTLEKIYLEEIDDLTHLTAKEILNCPNLNSLSICFRRPNFSFMGMLDEISSKTKPFTLNVLENSFKFPDDKAIWGGEIKKMEKKRVKN
jgi:hypothetical protein